LLEGWQKAKGESNVLQLLDAVLDESGYARAVRDGTEEGEDRWANIMELRTVAYAYAGMEPGEGLSRLLEEVALVSDLDDMREQSDAPTLLTLHMAKGLEFPVVFIVGLEEGIFPHSRSLEDPDDMAEERRLFYVGVTRAKDRLYLLRAFRRTLYGNEQMNEPSRFLSDIPAQLVEGNLPNGRRPARSDYPTTDWEPARRLSPGKKPLLERFAAPAPARRPTSPAQEYHAGEKVEHPIFGRGAVISSQIVGQDEELLIAFEGKGVKKLSVAMAQLRRIG